MTVSETRETNRRGAPTWTNSSPSSSSWSTRSHAEQKKSGRLVRETRRRGEGGRGAGKGDDQIESIDGVGRSRDGWMDGSKAGSAADRTWDYRRRRTGKTRGNGGGFAWGVAWLNATRTQRVAYVALPRFPRGRGMRWIGGGFFGLDRLTGMNCTDKSYHHSASFSAFLCVSHKPQGLAISFFSTSYFFAMQKKRSFKFLNQFAF